MAKFGQEAPKGPKIGPMRNYNELSEDKKADIGDPDKLFRPVQVDPRIAKAEAAAEAALESSEPEPARPAPEDVADELEALHRVVDREEQGDGAEEEEVDAEDIAITEEAKPTEEDKREFVRSIMGGTEYRKVYDVCGGAMKVEMVDPWPTDQEKVYARLAKDMDDGAIKTQGDWETWFDRYQLISRVGSIEIAATGEKTAIKHSPDLRADFGALVDQKRGTAAYQILMKIGRVFRRHVEMLVERSLDSDFWTDDGPALPSEQVPTERLTTDIPVARTGEHGKPSSSTLSKLD